MLQTTSEKLQEFFPHPKSSLTKGEIILRSDDPPQRNNFWKRICQNEYRFPDGRERL
jgi:hypothetical protein